MLSYRNIPIRKMLLGLLCIQMCSPYVYGATQARAKDYALDNDAITRIEVLGSSPILGVS